MRASTKKAINSNPDSVTRLPALHSVQWIKGNIIQTLLVLWVQAL